MPFLRASNCIDCLNLIQSLREAVEFKDFSVKLIFQEHWKDYKKINPVREIESTEVEKMLSCKGKERGCFMCYCKPCDRYEEIPFGCNSRICSCCSKRYTDRWAEMLSEKIIPKIPHRHLTFSMPEILWNFIKENRELQKIVMDASYQTIKDMFSFIAGKPIEPGVIAVLHPFGRDVVFKPHSHCIATEGGYAKDGGFVAIGQYINYHTFHMKWQLHLLNSLREFIPQNIIDYCFINYPKGFVAYARPERIYKRKDLIGYIGRYVRHPAIANSRIIDYNGKGVTFYYEDHDKNLQFKTMEVFDFISVIIQHIPERNQRLVRYYGSYSRKKINTLNKKSNQSAITDFTEGKMKKKRTFYCSICHEEMEILAYMKKPPDKDMSKITNWIE